MAEHQMYEYNYKSLSCKSLKVNQTTQTHTLTFQIVTYKARFVYRTIAGNAVASTKLDDRDVIKQTSEDAFECAVVVNTLTD